jgi:hypothetical protein
VAYRFALACLLLLAWCRAGGLRLAFPWHDHLSDAASDDPCIRLHTESPEGLSICVLCAASTASRHWRGLNWNASLEKKPKEATGFYAVIAVSTLIGIALNFIGINPIKALFWAAVLNGVLAALLMAVIMHMASSKKR